MAPVALVVGLLAAAATACGAPDDAAPPVLPTVDFRPKVIIEVDEAGVRALRGEREDPAVTVDPLALPQGTVMRVRNTGRSPHRLHAETVFDTGVLQPGDAVVVAVTKETTADTGYDVTDTISTDRAPGVLRLTIRPRPGT